MRSSLRLLALAAMIASPAFAKDPHWSPVDLPKFRDGADAIAWADRRVAEADQKQNLTPGQLLPAAAAYERARLLSKDSGALRTEATIKQAEVFLRLSAPNSALDSFAKLSHKDIEASGRAAVIYERTAEAAELMGHQGTPLATYAQALRSGPDAEWRSLILYRAGLRALGDGSPLEAAKYLEQAAETLPDTSSQGVLARASLARCYASREPARARAWASAAKQGLTRTGGKANLPRSFVREPSAEQLAAYVRETDASIRD